MLRISSFRPQQWAQFYIHVMIIVHNFTSTGLGTFLHSRQDNGAHIDATPLDSPHDNGEYFDIQSTIVGTLLHSRHDNGAHQHDGLIHTVTSR